MPYDIRANTERGSKIANDCCGPCLLSIVCSKAVRLSPFKNPTFAFNRTVE